MSIFHYINNFVWWTFSTRKSCVLIAWSASHNCFVRVCREECRRQNGHIWNDVSGHWIWRMPWEDTRPLASWLTRPESEQFCNPGPPKLRPRTLPRHTGKPAERLCAMEVPRHQANWIQMAKMATYWTCSTCKTRLSIGVSCWAVWAAQN